MSLVLSNFTGSEFLEAFEVIDMMMPLLMIMPLVMVLGVVMRVLGRDDWVYSPNMSKRVDKGSRVLQYKVGDKWVVKGKVFNHHKLITLWDKKRFEMSEIEKYERDIVENSELNWLDEVGEDG